MLRFFVFSFLFIVITAVVPTLGTVDKAAVQWLFLCFFNISIFLFFVFKKRELIYPYKQLPYSLYLIFIVLSLLSLFYSLNINLSVFELSHLLTLFFSLFLFYNIFQLYKPNFNNIAIVFFIGAIIESFYSLYPLFEYLLKNGTIYFNATSLDVGVFRGFTGNRNITTASLSVKLPFALFLLTKIKGYKKFFMSLFIILISLPVFLISSRAALLSMSFSFLVYISYHLFQNFRSNILNSISLIASVSSSYILSFFLLPSTNLTAIDKLAAIEITDKSSSNRFELWLNALDFISNNFFIGCGIGNWKVESSAYWGSLGAMYLVPYHAHNDFLHYFTELGFFGAAVYIFIFLFTLYTSLLIFRVNKIVSLTLFCSFSAYFIDSMLNFPYDRPIMLVSFIFLFTSIFYFKSYKYEN